MTNPNQTNLNQEISTETMQENMNNIQTAKVQQRRRISPFWLLPIIAFIIGATLFFQIIKEQGETIRITFASGDGLVANKTQIRYQGLQIGVVKKVNFTEDLKQVEVEASIYPEAKTVLRDETKFWLVQPNASLAGISGLDTLISGNYITLQPGDGDYRYKFVAEVEPPITQLADGDLLIRLVSEDLGSISQGASVYYKKLPVGKVISYRLSQDQKQVVVNVAIEKNYANLVKKDSRFWNISGIRAEMELGKVNFNVDSLQAVVQGAVTFDSPEDSKPADQDERFTLYPDLKSAQRGIEVKLRLPNEPIFKVGQEVYYQGLPVGILYDLDDADIQAKTIPATLLLDPSVDDVLRQNTKIVIRSPKINLGTLEKLPEMFRGVYFDILPGKTGQTQNEPIQQFTAIKENDLLMADPDALQLKLIAPETYGINQGQEIYYNNIAIGRLVAQQIDVDGVSFTAVIAPEYRRLIKGDTQFVAATNFDVSFGVDGLRMNAASPEKWLQGGVRIITGKQGEPKSTYPIYKDQESAEMGITAVNLTPNITLKSTALPNISKGSVVLYRQYEVGKVLDVHPLKDRFDVDVAIYPKFAHLLTEKSRFWVESATKVEITPKGVSIQASPVARALKGAISFDNNGNGKDKTLHINELKAKSVGQIITLTADDATHLSTGMSLRYMGLAVGEIESIKLDQNSRKIIAKALMNPNYMNIVAKEGSRFKVISPQISAGGIENLDSLLQPYIDVETGAGKFATQFKLIDPNSPELTKFTQGLPLILETTDASNISVDSPVMYRGVDVGKVKKLELNQLGDRVLIHIIISNKHAHLVRKNSEFWVSSGYTAGFGWNGIEVNTGSMQQLLKGGIAFSTPSSKVVQPKAKANQRFLLQMNRPGDARNWNSGFWE